MAQANFLQTNFTAGQLSPRLLGRTDVSKYYNGARELTNFVVQQHGGVIRRSGTKYVATARSSTGDIRLIPFQFSTTQAYVLEFGDKYVRFYKDRAQVTTDIALSTPFASWSGGTATATLTVASHTVVAGDTITVAVTGAANYDGTYIVTSVTATTILYALASDPGGTPSAGTVTVPYQITSPYTEAQLPQVNYAQSADIIFMAHPDVPPQELQRTASTVDLLTPFASWSGGTATLTVASGHGAIVGDTISVVVTGEDGYNGIHTVTAVTATTIDYALAEDLSASSPTDGTVTITSDTTWAFVDYEYKDGPYEATNSTDSRFDINNGAVGTGRTLSITGTGPVTFTQNDVGRHFRMELPSGTTGWGIITGYTSPTSVTAEVKATISTTSTIIWNLGAWGVEQGWPWTVNFHQSRLFWGGSNNKPSTLWGSVTGDFNLFSPAKLGLSSEGGSTVTDVNAITATLDDDQVNAIYWMSSSAKGLGVGTDGAEYIVSGGTPGSVITPDSVTALRQTRHGSKRNIRRQNASSGITLFTQKAGRKVRELIFDFDVDQFKAPDVTKLAEDITTTGIIDTAYAREPYTILWTALTNGTIAAMTYERDEEVIGWHKHVIGGSFGSGDAEVHAIAAIHDSSVTQPVDQLWLLVKRTINGATVQYIEFLEDFFDTNSVASDGFFVDSGVTVTGSDFSTVTGLEHLEGETVAVNTDGASHPNRVVTDGAITLQVTADKAHVGIPFTSTMQTLPLAMAPSQPGSRHKIRAAERAHILFHNTIGAKIMSDDVNFEEVNFRSGNSDMNTPPPLFTGTKTDIALSARHGREPSITIKQDQPLPMTILSVTTDLEIYASS